MLNATQIVTSEEAKQGLHGEGSCLGCDYNRFAGRCHNSKTN